MATVTARDTVVPHRIVGNQRKTITNVALDSSYPTGGETLTAADLRLSTIAYGEVSVYSAATTTVNVAQGALIPASGGTTAQLWLFDETPAEVANGADLAGLVVQVVAYGT